jgi:hypothetical protein
MKLKSDSREVYHRFFFSWFLGVRWDWIYLVRRPLIGLFYHPRMIDDECEAVSGMRIVRGNRSTRRKPAPVPLSRPQITQDLTWARTRTAAVGSRRLTAWAMERPFYRLTKKTDSNNWMGDQTSNFTGQHRNYSRNICTSYRIRTLWSSG